MRKAFIGAALVAFAVPVLADEQPATEDERLGNLERMVITAVKEQPDAERLVNLERMVITAVKEDQPINDRLTELEHVISTAPKEQPAEHQVDDKTAALLAEIEEE